MAAISAGDTLDDYRIDRLIASGGMASVFRATDFRTGLTVAIKVPHPEAEGDVVFYDRFQREEHARSRTGALRKAQGADLSAN